MKKSLMLFVALLLAGGLAVAQDTGGDKGLKGKPEVKTETKAHKGGKKGHKGGKKGKKGSTVSPEVKPGGPGVPPPTRPTDPK